MRKTLKSLTILFLLVGATVPASAQSGDFNKGISYYKQGQYARAVVEFEKIVKENPEYESGWRILGDAYLKLKRWGRAAEAFQKAIQLKSNLFVSHYGLAVARFNLGQYNDAAATLLRAENLANSPRERYQMLRTRGSAYFNLKQWGKAAQDLERALEIQRGGFQDFLQLGVANYHQGNFDRAREYLEQAQSLNASSSQAREYLGRLRYQDALEAIEKRQFGRAVTILKEYLESAPQDGDAWFNLGLAHLFAEEYGAAERALLTSERFSPDYWDTHNRLGFIYEKTGRYQKALDSYRTAHRLHSSDQIQESIDRVRERIQRGS